MTIMLNQKVKIKMDYYNGVDCAEGTIVAVITAAKGHGMEENRAMFKVRIGNMITDWIPDSDLTAVPNRQQLIAN